MLMNALKFYEDRTCRTGAWRHVDPANRLDRAAERRSVTRRRDTRDVLGNERRKL